MYSLTEITDTKESIKQVRDLERGLSTTHCKFSAQMWMTMRHLQMIQDSAQIWMTMRHLQIVQDSAQMVTVTTLLTR